MSHEMDEKDVEMNSVVEDDDVDELDAADADDELAAGENESTDNVGDVSVEINVEELIAKIETDDDADVARKKEIRIRLEELAEEKSFEDTYAVDLGSDEE
jgi:hypothetical protein